LYTKMRQVMKMKKLLKSKKGLSPVVAAIILIAVTVAVSIAVAAWMGSLTIGFMETSELTITHVDFTIGNATTGRIFVNVTNSGTSSFTVKNIRVNGQIASTWSSGTSDTIEPGNSENFTITQDVAAGSKYAVSLYDMDGTLVGAYTATA
jgi:flagellin-like protein